MLHCFLVRHTFLFRQFEFPPLLRLCSLVNFQTDLHEIFTVGWHWAIEQMIKFWWRSESPSRYRDCFPHLSLLGDTESGINWLCYMTLQCTACIVRLPGIAMATMTSLRHQPRLWYSHICAEKGR